MKKISKGLPLAALLSLCCVSGFAANNDMRNRENRDNECRKTCGSCETNRCMPTGMGSYTAPAKVCLCDEGNWFVTADFLWWTANQDGLNFATQGIGSSGATSVGSGNLDNLNHHDQHWDPGFRVGLGYTFEHDGWDLLLDYTWFRHGRNHHHSNNSESASVGTGSLTLFATAGSPNGFDNVSSATARWKHMLYQTLDLELGRWSWLGKHLAFRPHFGARAGFIDQRFNIGYVSANGLVSGSVNNKQKVDGVGPRAGLNSSWYFCGDWSIYGDAAFSVLWEQYDNHQTQNYAPTLGFSPVDLHNKFYDLKSVMDLGIGLRWEYYGCGNRWHMAIELGWEHHNWINHNQMPLFVGDTAGFAGTVVQNHGDLGLYGANLGVRFDF